MKEQYKRKVELLKATADDIRFEIIQMLKDGELCACRILESFQISQPTLSYHMRILTQSGLVNSERRGAWMRYTLNEEALLELKDMFADLSSENINCERCACRNNESAANTDSEHRCHRDKHSKE